VALKEPIFPKNWVKEPQSLGEDCGSTQPLKEPYFLFFQRTWVISSSSGLWQPGQVAWVNFSEICSMMKRPVDHVQQFVLAEFGTEGAIAGTATARAEGQGQDGQLVLKGRYQPKHCESLLRK
jgi:hypothetical protein